MSRIGGYINRLRQRCFSGVIPDGNQICILTFHLRLVDSFEAADVKVGFMFIVYLLL